MRRTTITLSTTLAVGIILGRSRALPQCPAAIDQTEVNQGMEGKEAIMYVAELAPGAAAGKHTHRDQGSPMCSMARSR
jgi:hypothetical protein